MDLKNWPDPIKSGSHEILSLHLALNIGDHTCALTPTGSVYCWGDNIVGQLGDGSAWKTTPSAVVAGFDYVVHLPVMFR